MFDIATVKNDFIKEIENINNINELETLRVNYLGKNGVITSGLSGLRNLSVEEKKTVGAGLNQLKNLIAQNLAEKKEQLEIDQLNQKLSTEAADVTLPVRQEMNGNIHIISKTMAEVEKILGNLGFEMADGPEIEEEFYNFNALNIAENHPARQMQDTFYLPDNGDKKMLLRTHTSSVQIRKMMESKPPLRIISMGKVYRCDSDQTHTPMFHQVEGLVIDKNINMGHLKWTLETLLKEFFVIDNVATRFRPSFFPFTEPSAELDIGYSKKEGQIKIGSDQNFMEILGCGMVHPQVLRNVGINPNEYQGFAFGIGIERLAMLKYGVNDLRMFFENDIRFLKHYGFKPFFG